MKVKGPSVYIFRNKIIELLIPKLFNMKFTKKYDYGYLKGNNFGYSEAYR